MTAQKRTRVRRKTTPQGVAAIKKKMDARLSEAATLQDTIEAAQGRLKELKVETEELLNNAGLAEYSAFNMTAAMVTKRSNAKNVVRVADFKKLVSEDDFMDSVDVPMANAKKVLSEKELEKCVDHTPGGLKDPVFELRRSK